MTDDLATWLIKQISSDMRAIIDLPLREAVERAATSGGGFLGTSGLTLLDVCGFDRQHADLEAKLRVAERHGEYDFPPDTDDGPGDYAWTGRCDYCHQPWPCPDLRDAAAPFAGRPGYLESWRP